MPASFQRRTSTFEEQLPLLNHKELLKNAQDEDRTFFSAVVYGLLGAQYVCVTVIALFCAPTIVEVLHAWNAVLITVLLVMIVVTFAAVYTSGAIRLFPVNWLLLVALTCSLGLVAAFFTALFSWQTAVLACAILAGTFILVSLVLFLKEILGWHSKSSALSLILVPLFGLLLTLGCATTFYLLKLHTTTLALMCDFALVMLVCFYIGFENWLILEGEHEVQVSVNEYSFTVLLLYWDLVHFALKPFELLAHCIGVGQEEGLKRGDVASASPKISREAMPDEEQPLQPQQEQPQQPQQEEQQLQQEQQPEQQQQLEKQQQLQQQPQQLEQLPQSQQPERQEQERQEQALQPGPQQQEPAAATATEASDAAQTKQRQQQQQQQQQQQHQQSAVADASAPREDFEA